MSTVWPVALDFELELELDVVGGLALSVPGLDVVAAPCLPGGRIATTFWTPETYLKV